MTISETQYDFIKEAEKDLVQRYYKFSKDSNNTPIKLGGGGVGTVFVGKSTQLSLDGFRYAIKCLNSKYLLSDELREKMMIEGQILSLLDHPNIIKLKDFIGGTELTGYRTYLILELIEGADMGVWMKRAWGVNNPIPLENSIFLMSQILEGIKYAHNTSLPFEGYDGVLHLDIKPANILVTSNGVKIIDFGISQGSSQQRCKRNMGTLSYMAPEQFMSEEKLDKRTDVYALGVLFREMITGRKWDVGIIQHNGTQQNYRDLIIDWKMNKPFPSLPDYCYNPIIDELIQKATQKNPNDRFQSCDEFIDELMKFEF